MLIDVDNPEAFEEIIWIQFWPSRYKKDRILPWATPQYPAFEKFIKDHIRKIIYVKGRKKLSRYVSKNNLNISRIPYLKSIFPDAVVIVPFRDPLQHAASLLRQHLNFNKIHDQDEFAKKYMRDIGHFDIGHNLRQVNFGGWKKDLPEPDPGILKFWLRYWVATYSYLLENAHEKIAFFSYDKFIEDPQGGMTALAGTLGISDKDAFSNLSREIRRPKTHEVEAKNIPSSLMDQSSKIYRELTNKAI